MQSSCFMFCSIGLNVWGAEKGLDNTWLIISFCSWTQVATTNLFYILYYSLAFLVVSHIAPFLAIACRNKDIIDVLHETQEKLELLNELQSSGIQQSPTGITGQSYGDFTTSDLSMNKINTKVIPDTSATQHGKKYGAAFCINQSRIFFYNFCTRSVACYPSKTAKLNR